jgi:arylsulfatase A-like enzyme
MSVPLARLIAIVVLSGLLAVPAAAGAAKRHNVVVIMTDDQDFRSMAALPKTQRLIADRGTLFKTSVVSFPLCCPSRATYYTGQYAHNHDVKWNTFPTGGFYKLDGSETLPVWLQRAGYRTIHIGKYLNQTDEREGLHTQVPKGWTDYHGGVDPSTYDYYGMTINDNGVLTTYGRTPADYSTTVYGNYAVKAIADARKAGKPFYMSLAPNAPHTIAVASGATKEGPPAVPPPGYKGKYLTASLPRYPNFDEDDISDKPTSIQQFFPTHMTEQQISELQDHYRGRMSSLVGVDAMVVRVIKALKANGVYKNTDVLFTSDNGWILGEHRLRDPVSEDGKASGVKYVPYEGSSHVPFMAAGPDFPKQTIKGVVVNADLAPTIAQIAGAQPTLPQDGRSLVPVARKPSLLAGRGVLLETFENPRGVQPYTSIRTQRYRYDVQQDGQEGFYDLKRDPWELTSVHNDERYAAIKAILKTKLAQLVDCKGKTCQVNVGPLPAPAAG